MRRTDREVTDRNTIDSIINSTDHFRIGFYDTNTSEVYVIPLHFGTEILSDGTRIFYSHGATEGRKIELAKCGGSVGFELDVDCKLKPAELACTHSASFQSIIGNGNISIVEDFDEKQHALQLIMKQATGKPDWDIPAEAINGTAVLKILVTNLSCKIHE